MSLKIQVQPQVPYETNLLYNLTTQQLEATEDAFEFSTLKHRQSVLMDLINSGIEYTTMKQLKAIH